MTDSTGLFEISTAETINDGEVEGRIHGEGTLPVKSKGTYAPVEKVVDEPVSLSEAAVSRLDLRTSLKLEVALKTPLNQEACMNLWLEDCKRLDAKVVHNEHGVFQILFG